MTLDPQSAPAASAPRPPRDNALDALRLIAVLFMIASHTSRLVAWDSRRDWSRFSLLIEPMTASLFLTLVGASLAHSWSSARARGLGRREWLSRQAVRALGLWAVSCVFYTLEDGPHFPDVVTMSGILATIAYTILMLSILVSATRPVPLLLGMAAAMLGLHAWLDLRGMKVFVLNAGNSPLLPLSLFACLGALGAFALAREGGGKRAVRLGLVAAALIAVELILRDHGFAEVFSKPLGRMETVRTIVTMKDGVRIEKDIPYYNLRPILVPMIAGLTVLLYSVLALARPVLDRLGARLLALGRRSLDVYILHLSLLAILVVAGGKRPLKAAWQGDAVVLAVIAICWLWVAARDRYPRFPWFRAKGV